MAALPPTPKLVTISTPGGAKFRVAAEHAEKFQGLVNDLEKGGYTLDPRTSGGYNSRYIAGTQTPSEHAFGRAIDVNWSDNPRGGMGKIPTDVARSLAKQYGLTWGGDWKHTDPMHFEVARNGQPVLVAGGGKAAVPAAAAPTEDYGGGGFGMAVPPAAAPPDANPATSTIDPVLVARAISGGPFGDFGGSNPLAAPTSLADVMARAALTQQQATKPLETREVGTPIYRPLS